MVPTCVHGTTHVTLCSPWLAWSPLSETNTVIIDPEPEVQGAAVVEAQPDEGRFSLLGLQLNPALRVSVEDGNQIGVFLSAVFQGVTPRLVLFNQLKT